MFKLQNKSFFPTKAVNHVVTKGQLRGQINCNKLNLKHGSREGYLNFGAMKPDCLSRY